MDSISKTKLICVEGQDEVNFFNALFSYMNIHDVQVIDFEGKSNFKSKLQALSLTRGFDKVTKIALVRDADNKPNQSAFQSLESILTSLSFTPPKNNQTFSKTIPSFGIFIMPGEDQEGALEDLCMSSLDKNYIICIERYFNCLNIIPKKSAKAKVLCYLSSKDPYSNSLGLAALKGHWNFSNNAFNELKTFVNFLR